MVKRRKSYKPKKYAKKKRYSKKRYSKKRGYDTNNGITVKCNVTMQLQVKQYGEAPDTRNLANATVYWGTPSSSSAPSESSPVDVFSNAEFTMYMHQYKKYRIEGVKMRVIPYGGGGTTFGTNETINGCQTASDPNNVLDGSVDQNQIYTRSDYKMRQWFRPFTMYRRVWKVIKATSTKPWFETDWSTGSEVMDYTPTTLISVGCSSITEDTNIGQLEVTYYCRFKDLVIPGTPSGKTITGRPVAPPQYYKERRDKGQASGGTPPDWHMS